MTLFEVWYLVSQYLIFLTGVIYAVVAYCQLRAIHRQADITEKSLGLLERAWIDVIIEPVNLVPNSPTSANCNLSNPGKTPAQVKEIKIESINIGPNLPIWNYKSKPTGKMPTIFMVFPNQPFDYYPQRIEPILKEVIDDLKSRKRFLTVYGWVFYDDLLEKRHVTRFYRSYKFMPDGSGLFVIPAEANPEYNEAD